MDHENSIHTTFRSIICFFFEGYDYQSVALIGGNPTTMWIWNFYDNARATTWNPSWLLKSKKR